MPFSPSSDEASTFLSSRSFDDVAPLRLITGSSFATALGGNAALKKLLSDAFLSYLVKLVNSHGNIGYPLLFSRNICNACKYLAVIDPDCHPYLQFAENAVNDLYKLKLVKKRVAADDINIALKKLPVSSLLRLVGPPYRLYLVSPERKGDLITMLNHEPCKGNSKVIPQSFLTNQL